MHPADSTALYAASVLWGLVVMGTTMLAGRLLLDVATRAWRRLRGEL